jgi:hypothetical protein
MKKNTEIERDKNQALMGKASFLKKRYIIVGANDSTFKNA